MDENYGLQKCIEWEKFGCKSASLLQLAVRSDTQMQVSNFAYDHHYNFWRKQSPNSAIT